MATWWSEGINIAFGMGALTVQFPSTVVLGWNNKQTVHTTVTGETHRLPRRTT
jgi:hypothetical protein